MTARLDSLRALRDAVKAGKRGLGWNTSSVFGNTQSAMDAVDAIDGSFDAAHALHKAVLPEWPLKVRFMELLDGAFGCSLHGPLVANGNGFAFAEKHEARADTPARAWLLAILAALIAQAEGEG